MADDPIQDQGVAPDDTPVFPTEPTPTLLEGGAAEPVQEPEPRESDLERRFREQSDELRQTRDLANRAQQALLERTAPRSQPDDPFERMLATLPDDTARKAWRDTMTVLGPIIEHRVQQGVQGARQESALARAEAERARLRAQFQDYAGLEAQVLQAQAWYAQQTGHTPPLEVVYGYVKSQLPSNGRAVQQAAATAAQRTRAAGNAATETTPSGGPVTPRTLTLDQIHAMKDPDQLARILAENNIPI